MSFLSAFDHLKNAFQGRVLQREPLARHTYYKIGGPVALLLFPTRISDLDVIADAIQSSGETPFFFGQGSNLLFSDQGLTGAAIKTSDLNPAVTVEENHVVRAGAGVSVLTLLRHAAKSGWDGFERFGGIPGNVGGLVAMNGGTHLGDLRGMITDFEVYRFSEKRIIRFSVDQLALSYRENASLLAGDLIWSAGFKLQSSDPIEVKRKIDEITARRKATQPLDFPSCGSVFKNPDGTSLKAWEVVDQCGLRGKKIGGAMISDKHPNWILNVDQAQATDVRELIALCKRTARERFQVELHEEVRCVSPAGTILASI